MSFSFLVQPYHLHDVDAMIDLTRGIALSVIIFWSTGSVQVAFVKSFLSLIQKKEKKKKRKHRRWKRASENFAFATGFTTEAASCCISCLLTNTINWQQADAFFSFIRVNQDFYNFIISSKCVVFLCCSFFVQGDHLWLT